MRRILRRKPIYYGWVIAFALAITETVSYGVMVYAFYVFITPMEADLGWTRAQISGAFSLSLLITGIGSVPVGWWLDRHGARLLMTVGSIGATSCVLLWSRVNTLSEFVLVMALLGLFGAAVLYEPAFAVVATWFSRRRGAAIAALTFIAGFSSTIFIPLTDALLLAQGWRNSVFILAIVLGAITIPLHALALRRRPADLGLMPDGDSSPPPDGEPQRPPFAYGKLLRSRFFWVLTGAFAMSTLSISALRVHLIPLLISLGVHSSSAAIGSGAIGIMQVLGRMIYAPIESRFSSKTMVIGVLATLTASAPILLLGSAPPLVILFIALFGMAVGTHTLARPMIVADTWGAAVYGRVSGAVVVVVTLAGTAAPFLGGLIYDVFASYAPMLLLATGLSLLATLLIVFLPKRGD